MKTKREIARFHFAVMERWLPGRLWGERCTKYTEYLVGSTESIFSASALASGMISGAAGSWRLSVLCTEYNVENVNTGL